MQDADLYWSLNFAIILNKWIDAIYPVAQAYSDRYTLQITNIHLAS
jgi:hypothetical protein